MAEENFGQGPTRDSLPLGDNRAYFFRQKYNGYDG